MASNTRRHTRGIQHYYEEGTAVYIEQYLQGGSDEEERDSRRSYVLNGKAQWDVTRVDRILAKLAHIPAELRAMAAERNYWRTTAEKCEVLSDFEDELPRHQQAARAQIHVQDGRGAYPSPPDSESVEAAKIDPVEIIVLDDDSESDEETPRPRRFFSPELDVGSGVGSSAGQPALSSTRRRPLSRSEASGSTSGAKRLRESTRDMLLDIDLTDDVDDGKAFPEARGLSRDQERRSTSPDSSAAARKRFRPQTNSPASQTGPRQPRAHPNGSPPPLRKREESPCPGSDPAENEYHERHLFDKFDILEKLESTINSKQLFQLFDVVAQLGQGSRHSVSLLDFAKSNHTKKGSELFGLAKPIFDKDVDSRERDDQPWKVRLVASDIVNLQPSWTRSGTSSLKDCALVLETRLASYRIESFSSNYADDFKSSAAVFVSAFAFAVLNGVRPSSTTEDLRAKLEAKLVREDNSLMPANAVLPAYRLQGFLGSFLPSISSAVLKLLNTLLPNPTFITPLVYEILMRGRVDLLGNVRTAPGFDEEEAQQRIDAEEKDLVRMLGAELKVWEQRSATAEPPQPIDSGETQRREAFAPSKKPGVTSYTSATVAQEIVSSGDYVSIAGHDHKKATAIWFGRVVNFYRPSAKGVLMVHLQWWEPLRKTWLGAVASPLELVFLDWCDGTPASTIIRKIEIQHVPLDTMRPRPSTFYFSYAIDRLAGSFSDASPLLASDDLPFCDANEIYGCSCCERRGVEELEKTPRWNAADYRHSLPPNEHSSPATQASITVNGFTMCLGDFVFVEPETPPASFRLAQLLKVVEDEAPLGKDSRVRVRWLFRQDSVFDPKSRDERRLVLSDVEGEIPARLLEGSFRLEHSGFVVEQEKSTSTRLDLDQRLIARERYAKKHPEAFWCTHRLVKFDPKLDLTQGTFPPDSPQPASCRERLSRAEFEKISCSTCRKRCETAAEDRRHVAELLHKHPSLRFDGCELYAGFGGLAMGIESGCPLLKTKTTVETNEYARGVAAQNLPVATHIGKPVGDFVEEACDTQPRPTAKETPFDALPSQPSSSLPRYDFVGAGPPCGFSYSNLFKSPDDPRVNEPFSWASSLDLFRPLMGVFENVRGVGEFVVPGAAPVRLLALLVVIALRLGFQARLASYATPQVRRRVFIIVALRGLPLPELPLPTHSDSHDLLKLNVSNDSSKPKPGLNQRRDNGAAPFPPIDLDAALSDLPANCDVDHPQEYTSDRPRSAFQRAARVNVEYEGQEQISECVRDHVVKKPADLLWRRLRQLGIDGEDGKHGDHRDIVELDSYPAPPPGVKNDSDKMKNWWKRLSWKDLFTTIRTTLNPDGTSHGPRIHPEHPRVVSARELARGQGFPDDVSLGQGSPEEMMKIVGNSVPMGLGVAIGRELFASLSKLILSHAKLENDPASAFNSHRQRAEAYRNESGFFHVEEDLAADCVEDQEKQRGVYYNEEDANIVNIEASEDEDAMVID